MGGPNLPIGFNGLPFRGKGRGNRGKGEKGEKGSHLQNSFLWRENMFSKKVLRIGLMALIVVALMSYSIAAEDKIIIGGMQGRSAEVFISSLQTPPPGYVLEKSFGSFVVVGEYAAFSFVNSKDVDETITKSEKVFEGIVKKLGGNAVLAERISTQATGRDGNRMLVIIQGEAALLKPVSK